MDTTEEMQGRRLLLPRSTRDMGRVKTTHLAMSTISYFCPYQNPEVERSN
jgi:hypothetical protein